VSKSTRQRKTLDKLRIEKNKKTAKYFLNYRNNSLGKDFAESQKTLDKLRIEKNKKNSKTFLKNYKNNSPTLPLLP
jgi:hypothetical protein